MSDNHKDQSIEFEYTFENRIKRAETQMGDRTAFFYGTLMAKEVLFSVIFGMSAISKHSVQTITQTPAILHNHQRSRVRHCDYPGVVPSEKHSVRGTYVTGLTDGDIYRLDMFEGSQYSLQTVRVRLLKSEGDAATGEGNVEGEEVETQTYIWTAGKDGLEDKEWDYATFREDKLRHWINGEPEEQGFDDDSDDDDKTGQEDDNIDPTGGRAGNGHIAQALEMEHEKLRLEKEGTGEKSIV